MRVVIAASSVTVIALATASVLGVASAEAPTTPPQRTVSVQGVATEALDQHASASTAVAVYHQGMADAVADGLGKAQLLAGKVGASLGPAQSVVEGGGYISCAAVGESGSAEYEGAQPDFGSSGVSISASPQAGSARPLGGVRKPSSKRRRSRKAPAAHKANTAVCTLSTQVSLVYPLS
jgi:uncharacterized protein YggE